MAKYLKSNVLDFTACKEDCKLNLLEEHEDKLSYRATPFLVKRKLISNKEKLNLIYLSCENINSYQQLKFSH